MAIDEALVRRLERLAALRLADDERQILGGQLARIVAYIDQLRGIDTTGLEACTHVVPLAAPRRPDEPRASLSRAEALSLSPATDPEYFVVPPVFGEPLDEDRGADGRGDG